MRRISVSSNDSGVVVETKENKPELDSGGQTDHKDVKDTKDISEQLSIKKRRSSASENVEAKTVPIASGDPTRKVTFRMQA